MTTPADPNDQAPLDLAEFETRIEVRRTRIEDFDSLVKIQELCFPGMQTWSRDQIASQIAQFPEGQMVVLCDGEVVASASSLIVDFERYEDWHDWKVVADSGYIRNHDPKGDTLYGIEIMVHPDYRGLKLARRLYEARKNMVRSRNLRRCMIGGRIPFYHKHADKMTATEYIEHCVQKKLFDPVLTVQLSNGFQLRGLVSEYLPSDKESLGHAVFLEWPNLDYTVRRRQRLLAVSRVRLCLAQYHMRRVASFEEFQKQVEFIVSTGSDYKSDFIVFPELFTTQLLSLVESGRPEQAARDLAAFTPDYLEMMNELAIRYNTNIVGGSQLAVEDNDLYNISYLFRRDGTIGKQYKLHITPNERRWWGVSPGNKVEVFDTDRGRIAILICYDAEFPELARIAVHKGAQIIFVPFNTDERYGYLRVRHCAQARAIENQVYVAIAGCAGMMPNVDNADMHYAQCAVLTPSDFPFARDAVASESMPNIETIVVHDVDLEMTRRNRSDGTVRPWTDRRHDLYKILYEDGDAGQLEI